MFIWFRKPRSVQTSQRGDGEGLVFWYECLIDEVECMTSVHYGSMWMKIQGHRGRESLFVGCV